MLPAGVIDRIDRENEVVHVSRTKDEIKNAPEYHQDHDQDESYRGELDGYYARTGGTGSGS